MIYQDAIPDGVTFFKFTTFPGSPQYINLCRLVDRMSVGLPDDNRARASQKARKQFTVLGGCGRSVAIYNLGSAARVEEEERIDFGVRGEDGNHSLGLRSLIA